MTVNATDIFRIANQPVPAPIISAIDKFLTDKALDLAAGESVYFSAMPTGYTLYNYKDRIIRDYTNAGFTVKFESDMREGSWLTFKITGTRSPYTGNVGSLPYKD